MSTIITTGFRLRAGVCLDDVFAWADGLRTQCRELAEEALATQIAKRACYCHDTAAMSGLLAERGLGNIFGIEGESGSRSPLTMAAADLHHELLEQSRSPYRDPDVDYDFSLTLMPAEGAILGIAFTEKQFFMDALMDSSPVEPYAYRNDTDSRPEGVTLAEWKERERLWFQALPRGSTPAQRGITISIVSAQDLVLRGDLRKIVQPEHLPPLEQRASPITRVIHTELSMRRLCQERGLDIHEVRMTLPNSVFFDAMNDERGRPEVHAQVLKNLDTHLSLEDLTQKEPGSELTLP